MTAPARPGFFRGLRPLVSGNDLLTGLQTQNAASARPGQVEERISGPAWSTLGRGPGAGSDEGTPRSLRSHSGRDSHRDGLPVRAPRAGSAAARAALGRSAGGGAAASVRAA